jgi:inner membrane transporter RhtA
VSLVLIGILSVQFGAAVSKGLFGEIPPVGMVLLRLVTSSLILLALARPGLGGRTAVDRRPVLARSSSSKPSSSRSSRRHHGHVCAAQEVC